MIRPRVAVALILVGALMVLAADGWPDLPTESRLAAGAAVLGTILILLGVHRGRDDE